MAGGFGTRLRPLTAHLPKPMVPLGNKPIMAHTVELLARHGVSDCVMVLYFMPETITSYFGDGSAWGIPLRYVTPTTDLGTAGAVRFAAEGVKETVMVLSGDILTDFDLSAALDFHRKHGAEATMVLTRVENPLPYGIVMTDDSGRIVRFLEKPSWGEVFSDTINTGIYILEPSVLSLIPSDRIFDFGKDLFPRLLAAGHPLFGYIAEGYWRDVGDLVEYRLAHLDLLHGKVKVGIPGKKIEGIDRDIWFDEGARVDFTARLSGAVIVGAGTQIHANARIENSVIGANCVIGEGATVSRSVLWDGVEVGRRARLTECVVGRKAHVKNEAFCAEGVVVSDHSTIGAGAIVKANVKVWPYKEVEDGATLAVSLVWGERWTSSLFGRYGITGVANLEISPEFAAKLGAAFGATLGRRQMVITSRDHHKASRMINRALMTGLLSAGVDVADLGIAPIPVVRYQIRALGLAGGTHVRKSPFDPVLLDIRCFDERGMDISPEKEKGVERLFFREDFPRATMDETGTLSFPHAGVDRYRDGLLRTVDRELVRKSRIRVVLDYAFGPASQIFPGILGALGVEVISLNAYLDEGRITRTAEEFNASLGTLSNIVRTLGADVGILFDTGGEKLFLVDEKGEQVSGQLALALFALLVMRTHPPGILAVPVTASHVLEQLAAEHGFQVRRVRSLPRSLMETAMEPGVAFVGEEWGGAIFPEVQPAFDGMAAAIKLLEMMAKLDVRLHHLTRSVPETHLIQVEVTCPNEKKGRVMRQLVESAKGETAELVEGVRIHKNEAWVAAIPHPDRAVFQIIAEAPTREAAQQLATTYAGLIEKAKSDA